jgi:4-alpha-glucanotransferase
VPDGINLPGTVGAHNWTWRFKWTWLGSEPTRMLGLITAASGRAEIGLLGLPG